MDSSTNQKKFRVLSIDGGGIKGIIPIYFCDLLEKMTGKKIYDLFDFFAGTSIGGIISLFFSQRIYSAGELLVKMLGQLKNKIFPSKRYFQYVLFKKSLYDPMIIEEVLQELLGQVTFKDSKGNFLVTGSEMNNSVCDPCIFVNFNGKTEYLKVNFNREEQDFFRFEHVEKVPDDLKLWQIARITSAAYPYFSKFIKIADLEFLDGGYTYNNPSFLAIKYLEEKANIDLNSIFMLSLGCNEDTPRQSLDISFLEKNILNIGSEMLSNLQGMNDNMNNSSYNCVLLCDAYLRKRHVRISPINMEPVSLDCVDNESICKLQSAARKMVKRLKKYAPIICNEVGIEDNSLILHINKNSKFYIIPRYYKYKECYCNLEQFLKTNPDKTELVDELDRFEFPEDVKESQQIIKLAKPSGFQSFFCCSSYNTNNPAALAIAIGHLDTLRKYKNEEDPFKFLEYNTWSLFHTAAANCELGGILILIEDEYLEPGTLNKFGDHCYFLDFRKDITFEKMQKLINVFQTHQGVIYDEEKAKTNDTPLGLAYKYKAQEVINFHKRCKKILTSLPENNPTIKTADPDQF